jgi:hypothetical protein
MIIRFKATNSTFEINTIAKKIRRVPENTLNAWKQYVRISKVKVGMPVHIVWATDDYGASARSTLTSSVVSYETV